MMAKEGNLGFRQERYVKNLSIEPEPEKVQMLSYPLNQSGAQISIGKMKRIKLNCKLANFQWSCLHKALILVIIILFFFVFLSYRSFKEVQELEKMLQVVLKTQKHQKELSESLMGSKYFQIEANNYDIFQPEQKLQKQFAQLQSYNSNIRELYAQTSSKFAFYARLFTNWQEEDQLLDQMDYFRLNQEYNLDTAIPQQRLCILSPFKNLLKSGPESTSAHTFLKSINAQNYSNYHVYLIDDASTDNSSEFIQQELPKYPRLSNRITLIRNKQSVGALANRDHVTRKFCQPGDIVMDIDGDDALIGKQVFNMFNRFYHNDKNAWFVYTNFIQIQGESQGDGRKISLNMSAAQPGPSAKIRELTHKTNTYRTDPHQWCTSELRSYLRDLYVKIPESYLMDPETGKYYIKASDRFVMYALAELAGPNHTFFYQEYPYFYYQPNYRVLAHYECSFPIIQYYQAEARSATPFQPLESLSQEAQRTKDYKLPEHIINFSVQTQYRLLNCLKSATGFKVPS